MLVSKPERELHPNLTILEIVQMHKKSHLMWNISALLLCWLLLACLGKMNLSFSVHSQITQLMENTLSGQIRGYCTLGEFEAVCFLLNDNLYLAF